MNVKLFSMSAKAMLINPFTVLKNKYITHPIKNSPRKAARMIQGMQKMVAASSTTPKSYRLPPFLSMGLKAIFAVGLLGMGARADTTTNRLNLVLPAVGSANWGPRVNSNFQVIDSTVAAQGKSNVFTSSNTFNGPVLLGGSIGTSGECFQTQGSGQAPTWGACGGSGGGGSSIYPATGTASFPFGMDVSTITSTGQRHPITFFNDDTTLIDFNDSGGGFKGEIAVDSGGNLSLAGSGYSDIYAPPGFGVRLNVNGTPLLSVGDTGAVASALQLQNVTGTTQCMQADASGNVTGTGAACSSGATWGGITGTLSDQIDLQSALDAVGVSTGILSTSTTSLQSQIDGISGGSSIYPATGTPSFPFGMNASGTVNISTGPINLTWSSVALSSWSYIMDTTSVGTSASTSIADNLANFSASFWIKASHSSGIQVLIGKRADDANAIGWNVSLNPGVISGQAVVFEVVPFSGSPWLVYSSVAVANNAWHNVVVTWNAGTQKIYVDGVDATVAWVTGSNTNFTNASPFCITTCDSTDRYLDYIDEVRLYASTLNVGDAATLFSGNDPGKPMISYWPLQEGSGLLANDASGNGNTITFSGTADWSTNVATPLTSSSQSNLSIVNSVSGPQIACDDKPIFINSEVIASSMTSHVLYASTVTASSGTYSTYLYGRNMHSLDYILNGPNGTYGDFFSDDHYASPGAGITSTSNDVSIYPGASLGTGGGVKFVAEDGDHYWGLRSSNTLASYLDNVAPLDNGTAGQCLTTDGNNPSHLSWSTVGGSVVLASSGIAFGSATNAVASDTNTLVYFHDGSNSIAIGTSNPYIVNSAGTNFTIKGSSVTLDLENSKSEQTGWFIRNNTSGSYNEAGLQIMGVAGGGGFLPGVNAGDTVISSNHRIVFQNSWPTGGVSLGINGALSASQFVKTDASKNLASYDLFNDSPTWTGQQSWTSGQPSTFTILTATSLTEGTSSYASYNSSGTITPNATLGNNISIVLHSSATINVPTNAKDMQMFRFRMIQDAAGSRSVTLGAGFHFGVDVSTWSASTAANKTDYLGCIYDAANSACDVVSGSIRGY